MNNTFQEENYKGYKISIFRLEHWCENPFEDWDCLFPLMTKGRHIYAKDYSNGGILDYISSELTYNKYKRHFSDLLEIAEYDKDEFNEEFPLGEYSGIERFDELCELIWAVSGDDFDKLEELCDILNIPCLNTYSQGDCADLFICSTEEFSEVTGLSKKEATIENMQGSADIYSAWAGGDVYGWSIEQEDSAETGDSCGGYYGDKEIPYMIEEAKGCIDSILEEQEKKRLDKELTMRYVSQLGNGLNQIFA